MSVPDPNKTVIAGDVSGARHEIPVSELRWRPAAYGFVIKNDALLLVPAFGGYSLPGGGLDLGESIEEGLTREVFEETGVVVAENSSRLLGVESNFFIIPGKSYKGPKVQSILLYYSCEFASGELTMEHFDEDEKEYGGFPEWVPLSKLPEIKVADSIDWRKYILTTDRTE